MACSMEQRSATRTLQHHVCMSWDWSGSCSCIQLAAPLCTWEPDRLGFHWWAKPRGLQLKSTVDQEELDMHRIVVTVLCRLRHPFPEREFAVFRYRKPPISLGNPIIYRESRAWTHCFWLHLNPIATNSVIRMSRLGPFFCPRDSELLSEQPGACNPCFEAQNGRPRKHRGTPGRSNSPKTDIRPTGFNMTGFRCKGCFPP